MIPAPFTGLSRDGMSNVLVAELVEAWLERFGINVQEVDKVPEFAISRNRVWGFVNYDVQDGTKRTDVYITHDLIKYDHKGNLKNRVVELALLEHANSLIDYVEGSLAKSLYYFDKYLRFLVEKVRLGENVSLPSLAALYCSSGLRPALKMFWCLLMRALCFDENRLSSASSSISRKPHDVFDFDSTRKFCESVSEHLRHSNSLVYSNIYGNFRHTSSLWKSGGSSLRRNPTSNLYKPLLSLNEWPWARRRDDVDEMDESQAKRLAQWNDNLSELCTVLTHFRPFEKEWERLVNEAPNETTLDVQRRMQTMNSLLRELGDTYTSPSPSNTNFVR